MYRKYSEAVADLLHEKVTFGPGKVDPGAGEVIWATVVVVPPPSILQPLHDPHWSLLLFLTGAGPLLAWRSTSFQSIKQNLPFTIPLIVAAVITAVLYAMGVRGFYVTMTVLLTGFVAATWRVATRSWA